MLSISQKFARTYLKPHNQRLIRSLNQACWNCNRNTSDLFCLSCKSLQKPDTNKNFFEVIGVKENYNLNENTLSKKFKDLQKLLHPDKFSNKNQSEQIISEEYSSLVNKAYSTLLNPLSRGLYMLNLKGVEISEDTQLESKFLQDIMERNEEIEDASTPDEILRIEKENNAILKDLQNKVADCLNSGNIDDAKSIVIRMKYFDSINNQIKTIIRRMNIVK